MNFEYSEDQELLKSLLSRFHENQFDFAKRQKALLGAPLDHLHLWDDWNSRIGLCGALLPEANGGLGGKAVEAMIIMEEIGRSLVVDPFLETMILGAGILKRQNDDRYNEILSAVAQGRTRIALAWTEPTGRNNPCSISTTATKTAKGWSLTGEKIVVSGGPSSDYIIVSARTSGLKNDREGISLFLIEMKSLQSATNSYRTIDAKSAFDISLKNFSIDSEALIGEEGHSADLLELVIDEAIVGVCAEALGAFDKLLSETVEYTKNRQQFGQSLSKFQVLQHRMVDMYMASEMARSAVILASVKLKSKPAERRMAVSTAKAQIGKSAKFIGEQAVQLHGGMGMTEELSVGHYFKRLTAIQNEYGTRDYHLKRIVALAD